MKGGDSMVEIDITLDRLCVVLGAAASGTFTVDAEFRLACRRACQIARAGEKLATALGVEKKKLPLRKPRVQRETAALPQA
jgi:hypothetical protein